jgi:nitrogen fixation protein FixH
MKSLSELSGRHVLYATLAFFALVTAVNAVFIYFAIRSYPGESEAKSYRQGLRFNETLEARAAQAGLGWRASIDRVARDGDDVLLSISIRGRDTAALDDLAIAGSLTRPASAEGQRAFAFTRLGGGRFEARIAAPPGAWDLTLTANGPDGARFEATNRVIVE